MRDQNEFMRQMLELVDLAKAQESRITKDQVKDFCSDLNLTAPQLKLVYDFLDEHNIPNIFASTGGNCVSSRSCLRRRKRISMGGFCPVMPVYSIG